MLYDNNVKLTYFKDKYSTQYFVKKIFGRIFELSRIYYTYVLHQKTHLSQSGFQFYNSKKILSTCTFQVCKVLLLECLSNCFVLWLVHPEPHQF